MKISVEYIIAQLQRRASERQLPRVAAGAGISLRTLHRIVETRSCRTATAEQLQAYLSLNEKKRDLDHAGK